jgi:hypothetical protein
MIQILFLVITEDMQWGWWQWLTKNTKSYASEVM